MSVTSQSVALDRAELIEIAGVDAIAFAHAQFSSDVAGLAAGAWQWSAWLTAQGRVHGVFALLRVEGDRLLLWLPLGGARAMRDALARYVLRAKARLDVHDDWALHAPGNAALPAPSTIVECDGGYSIELPGSRVAWLGDSHPTEYDRDALNLWRRTDVAAGLPWIAPATRDEFVPQALDLGQLDAIRFDKGCFPGQEIAARLHFRGGVKQRLRRVILRGEGEVVPGVRIEASGSVAGVVLYGARSGPETFYSLAVVNDAAPRDAHLASSNGHRIELQ
ncbi:MAG TPA: folate-binding protein [Rhodanobacteraceae bacterium]|nr:folate-binding protein [Rhodanobacteraceae bacterium]